MDEEKLNNIFGTDNKQSEPKEVKETIVEEKTNEEKPQDEIKDHKEGHVIIDGEEGRHITIDGEDYIALGGKPESLKEEVTVEEYIDPYSPPEFPDKEEEPVEEKPVEDKTFLILKLK